MSKIALVIVLVGLAVSSAAPAAPVEGETLRAQNPFGVVEQLTEFSYDELAQMYPALSEVELRSLRWRIVNHMQGWNSPSHRKVLILIGASVKSNSTKHGPARVLRRAISFQLLLMPKPSEGKTQAPMREAARI